MKYLITGGAGYIGSHTIHYLISKEVNPSDIFVFDNLSYGHRDLLPEGVRFIQGDLLNEGDIEKVFQDNKIDYVIHFASYISVAESVKNPGKYFRNNVLGGLNLLDAMVRNNCKNIIISSTAAVYDSKDDLLLEDDRKNPISPYGESKLTLENIVKYYTNIFNFKTVIFRYFNAAGAAFGIGEDHNPETHLIPLVLREAKSGVGDFAIYGNDYDTADGTCIRDYIHVLDLAEAHYLAIDYINRLKEGYCDVFNLGNGKGVSVEEVVNIAKKVTGVDFNIIREGRRGGDSKILVASSLKAMKYLGWSPRYDIEEIIKSAWEWEDKVRNL